MIKHDQEPVKRLMREYPLQFPDFVANMYPQRWEVYLNKTDLFRPEYYVAVDKALQVSGHAGFIYNNQFEMYEYVGVVVSVNHQRQGIGKQLLDTLKQSLRSRGCSKVMLSTLGHPGNEGTLAFYRSLGYQELKYDQDYYMEGYSRVTFIKDL